MLTQCYLYVFQRILQFDQPTVELELSRLTNSDQVISQVADKYHILSGSMTRHHVGLHKAWGTWDKCNPINVAYAKLHKKNCREQRFINRSSVNDLVDSDITVISAATKKQNKFRGKRLGIFAQQSTTFSLEGVVKLAHWHGSFEGRFDIISRSGQKCEIWQRSVGNLVSRPGSVGLIGRL